MAEASRRRGSGLGWIAVLGVLAAIPASGDDTATLRNLVGAEAMGDFRLDAPGVRRLIRLQDLPPAPARAIPTSNPPEILPRPTDAKLRVPPGFGVDILANGFENPRLVRVAPNGDVFIAESAPGRLSVLRLDESGGAVTRREAFADHLNLPFGIAFYPPRDPRYVYIATNDAVLRFPYRPGDLRPTGPAETVAPLPPQGEHWTRDVAFDPDGRRMYVSVGSATDHGDSMPTLDPPELRAFVAGHAVGAAWGPELERANVLVFDPDGGRKEVFATGLRNCVSLNFQPGTGKLWCTTNERDLLGDDLPPDFVTRVARGSFFGWPWYYPGPGEDPLEPNERPDLTGAVAKPDVLLQAHSAPLGMTFYTGDQFPDSYRGAAFVAFQGSWNRTRRNGSKLVTLAMDHGVPTGAYEDFLTGFTLSDRAIWGRPVGVATAKDGSLLMTDEIGGLLWRISYAR